MGKGIARGVMGQLSKSLIVTAIVICISIVVMQANQAFGIIVMMLYSSWMVIRSSRKEMPLTKLTALLPGLTSLLCFLVMLSLLGVENPIMPLVGCGAGLFFGIFMAKGHKVYIKNGVVYSQRTLLYVVLWTASILFTQGSTLFGLREIVDFGLLLNGFSTSGMVILSLYLVNQKRQSSSLIGSGHSLLLVFLIPFLFSLGTKQYPSDKLFYKSEHGYQSVSLFSKTRLELNDNYLSETATFSSHHDCDPFFIALQRLLPQRLVFEHQVSNLGVVLDMPRRVLEEIFKALSPIFFLQSLFEGLKLTEEATAAGAAASVLQILLGLGLNGATAVAQSTAAAAPTVTQEAEQDDVPEDKPPPSNNILLSGAEALQWMKDPQNGYMDDNGFTEKFRNFESLLPSQTSPDLQGIAFNYDDKGNPTGDFTIVVAGDNQPQTSDPQKEEESEEKEGLEGEKSKEEVEPEEKEGPEGEKPKEKEEPEKPVRPPSPPPPSEKPETITELRDRWRDEAQDLKNEIDHKKRVKDAIDKEVKKLTLVYDVERQGTFSDAVVDSADLFFSWILDKKALSPSTLSGNWWKSAIKSGLKQGLRSLIYYNESGEIAAPDLTTITKATQDGVGIKPNALPDGAYKQYLLDNLQKMHGSEVLSNDLGAAGDFVGMLMDTNDAAERVKKLRETIVKLSSESRRLGHDIEHQSDDYDVANNAANDADRDIAEMRAQGLGV